MTPFRFFQYSLLGAFVVLALAYLLPASLILMTANIMSSAVGNLATKSQQGEFGGVLGQHRSRRITTGGDQRGFKKTYEKLVGLTALPGEAARNTSIVHVGLISFKRTPNRADQSNQDLSAFTPVSLDVSGISTAGAVLITDSPIIWELKGASEFKRARLALEGRAPFDVKNLPQGFLAGTKTPVSGAHNVIGPYDIDKHPREFCKSMLRWSDFFAVPHDAIAVWLVGLDAQNATLGLNFWGFRGGSNKPIKLGYVNKLCSKARLGNRFGFRSFPQFSWAN